MTGQIKRNDGDVQIQSLKKGQRFVRFHKGESYVVTVQKRRLPNKYSALLWVTSDEHGEELLNLSRTVWVETV